MNTKLSTIIIITSVSVAAIIAFLALNAVIFNPKVKVTNMQLAYGPQTIMGINIGGSTPVLAFSVKNLHNSYLTTVGVIVNGHNYGQNVLQIPPGQTQSESISLANIALSGGTSYKVELTFTFADGEYETYIESCSTPQFEGDAEITASSLTVTSNFLSDMTSFYIEIQNTGNMPITSAKCTIQGYRWELTLVASGMPLLPGKTASTGWGAVMTGHEVGGAYSATIPITFQDGSTTTLTTSVIAQSAN